MSADVIPLRLPPPDLLASTHPGITASSTAGSAAVEVVSTGAPGHYRITIAPSITATTLDAPEWWAKHGGPKLTPGDRVDIYVDALDGSEPRLTRTMICEKLIDCGPVMMPMPRRLRADAVIPEGPIDAVMAFLKSARSPLTVADIAIMAGLTSRKERLIVKAIEQLGWQEPWPPEFSKLERNRRIIEMAKDLCTAAGVSTNEAPSPTAVNRFFRAIDAVAPRRRTERK